MQFAPTRCRRFVGTFFVCGGNAPYAAIGSPHADTRLPPVRGLNRRPRNAPLPSDAFLRNAGDETENALCFDAGDDAWQSGVISQGLDVCESCLFEEAFDGVVLSGADFDHEGAALGEALESLWQ